MDSVQEEDPKAETVSPKTMHRWSFFELLVRVSKEIFLEKKRTAVDHSTALDQLIKSHFITNWHKLGMEPWQDFR